MVIENMDDSEFRLPDPDNSVLNPGLEPDQTGDEGSLVSSGDDEVQIDDVDSNTVVAEVLQDIITRVVVEGEQHQQQMQQQPQQMQQQQQQLQQQQPTTSTVADRPPLQVPREQMLENPSVDFLPPNHAYRHHPNPSRVSTGAAQPATSQPVRPDTTEGFIHADYMHLNPPGEPELIAPPPRVYVTAQTVEGADQVLQPNWQSTEDLRKNYEALCRTSEQLRKSLMGTVTGINPRPPPQPKRPAPVIDRSARPTGQPAQPARPTGQPARPAQPKVRPANPNVRFAQPTVQFEQPTVHIGQPTIWIGQPTVQIRPLQGNYQPNCQNCQTTRRENAKLRNMPSYNGSTFVLSQPLYDDSFFMVAHIPNPMPQQPRKPRPSTVTSTNYPSTSFSNDYINHGRYVCYWCTYTTNNDKAIANHLMIEHSGRFSNEK